MQPLPLAVPMPPHLLTALLTELANYNNRAPAPQTGARRARARAQAWRRRALAAQQQAAKLELLLLQERALRQLAELREREALRDAEASCASWALAPQPLSDECCQTEAALRQDAGCQAVPLLAQMGCQTEGGHPKGGQAARRAREAEGRAEAAELEGALLQAQLRDCSSELKELQDWAAMVGATAAVAGSQPKPRSPPPLGRGRRGAHTHVEFRCLDAVFTQRELWVVMQHAMMVTPLLRVLAELGRQGLFEGHPKLLWLQSTAIDIEAATMGPFCALMGRLYAEVKEGAELHFGLRPLADLMNR